MQIENNPQEKAGSKNYTKKIIISILIILFVSLAVLFFAIPAYLSSSSGKNMILGKVNSSIDGKVAIDSFSMGWFKGIQADKLNFKNNAGNMTFSANQIAARPSYLALIGGKVAIDKATIDKPYLSINVTERPPEKPKEPGEKEEEKTQAPALPVDRINLTISQGNCKISSLGKNQAMQTLELRDINSKIALKPLGSKSSFDVSMTVTDTNQVSQISAAGQIKTAEKKWSLAGANGNLTIEIDNLELAALSPLLDLADVNLTAAGTISADINAKITKGQFENLQGNINASQLDISGPMLKGDRLQSSKFQTQVNLNTTENDINIESLNIEADGLSAKAKGTMPRTLKSFEDFLRADSTDNLQAEFDCDLAKILKQVKTIAGFKQDFDINYGRLSGNINTQAQNGTRNLTSNIKLWALEGKFPVKRIVLSKPVELQTKIVSQQQQITIEKMDLTSSFVNAQLNGTIDNMNYTADVDLANLQSDVGQFFEIKPQLSGSAHLSGKASLEKRIFSSTANAVMNNILIRMPDGAILSEPNANAAMDFAADLNNKQFSAKTIQLTASPGKINISNLVMPLGEGSQSPTKLNAAFDVQLTKLYAWAAALEAMDANTQLSGLARGDLAFSKTGSVIEAATKQINIENLNIASPGKEPFNQSAMTIAFNGKFDTAQKVYDIPQLSIVSPQIKLSGSLSNADLGTQTKTQGDFKATYDLAAASSVISPFMPQGLSATGKRNDVLQFSSTWPKNAPAQFTSNLNARTTFGFDTAQYMGLNLGKSDFNVQIQKGLMTIAPFSTQVNNGTLNFAGSANLSAKPPMLQLPAPTKILDKIEITKETTDLLLVNVNPIFANAVDVTGILSFDCETLAIPLEKGYENSTVVIGTMSIDNMRLGATSLLRQIIQLTGVSNNPLITVLPTRFVLENGVLRYDNMQMNFDDTPVNFSGQIGLDKSMKMNVTLPWTRNGQRVTLPLKGTVSNPQIDIGKLAEDQFKQELENQIKEGLEKIFK